MERILFTRRNMVKSIAVFCVALILLTGCGTASTIEAKPFDVDGAWQYGNLLNADLLK